MILIEKGIPLPPSQREKYPFPEMEVGDSFYVSGKARDNISAVSSHWRKKNGWEFTTRKERDGVRVWRVK